MPGVDAVLYEVTEKMYLVDAAGNVVGPEQAVSRKAQASLAGWARVGTPLCPAEQMDDEGRALGPASVTAEGLDTISLLTGRGTVDGSFAVVVQDDNATDGPEFVVMNGSRSAATWTSRCGRSARWSARSFRILPVRRCRSVERSVCRSPSILGPA